MNRIIWFFGLLISLSITQLVHADFFDRYEKLTPQDLPELSFTNPEGQPVTLEAYKGRIVVLNIWSITCGPCVAEMPSLDQLAGSFDEDKLMILPLNVDPIKKIGLDAFYGQNQYRYLGIFQDPTRQSQEALKWNALPTTLIINKDGKLIGRKIGATKWDDPQVIKIFEQLIEGKEIAAPQPSFTDKIKGFFKAKS
ncbi:MAG: TlpA family protein disulfide reductase [Janthinobacterium lividum]